MTLQQTLSSLVIPNAFAQYNELADTTILTDLYTWKSNLESSLSRLDSLNISALSVSELADLVRVLAPLTAVAQWSSPVTRSLASVYLAKIHSSDQLIVHVLTQIVKPIFAPTPHPRLDTSTARILPRSADIQDTYIEQPWKGHPGLDAVIQWCILHTESPAYEKAWPLFLPPVMSFLDDYQVPYKLLGVRLVSDMLTRVPLDLLIRTGVDVLMFTSLVNSLSHLGDQSTPDFIRSTVSTTLQLIDLTAPSLSPSGDPRDSEHTDMSATVSTSTLSLSQSSSLSIRFSRLSTLLSSSLLGTVIMYTPTFLRPISSTPPAPDLSSDSEHEGMNPILPSYASTPQKQSVNPILVAAAQSLPPVLSALGIGGARFLKGIIPVIAGWLALPLPIVSANGGSDDSEDIALHLASLSTLSVLFCTCAPQILKWSTTIVDALGRCWVGCMDIENNRSDLLVLRQQLKKIAAQLAKACPEVIKNQYTILLHSNKALFKGLLEEV